jgi:hypothetical protein
MKMAHFLSESVRNNGDSAPEETSNESGGPRTTGTARAKPRAVHERLPIATELVCMEDIE